MSASSQRRLKQLIETKTASISILHRYKKKTTYKNMKIVNDKVQLAIRNNSKKVPQA
jgi:hypothetical protein